MQRTAARVWILGLCAGAALLYLLVAFRRPADVDEGYFLAAGAQVERGKRPYLDFLFPQMPGMAWFVGLEGRVLPERTLPMARVPFAILSAASLVLLGLIALDRARQPWDAVAATVLVAGSEILATWAPLVKVHAPTMFLMLAGFLLAVRAEGSRLRVAGFAAAAGIFWAAAFSFRLLVLPAIPIVAIWIAMRGKGAGLAAFLGGLALGLVPLGLLAAADPSAFLTNNLGFHASARGTSLIADLPQKGFTLLSLVASLQAASLLALAAWSAKRAGLRRFWREPEGLALALVVALGAVFLLPSPTFTQYYGILVPFAAIAALPALGSIPWRKAAAAGLLAYVATAPVYAYREIQKWSSPHSFRVDHIREVSDAVSRAAAPDEAVLDFWGTYAWTTSRPPHGTAAGWTSIQYGRAAGDRVALQNRAPGTGLLLAQIRAQSIPVVVWMGLGSLRDRADEVVDALEQNYVRVYDRSGTVVYRRRAE